MISTKHNAFSTNKTVILVVTLHFQRITLHSSILKCKPNDLLTTSNKPSDDLMLNLFVNFHLFKSFFTCKRITFGDVIFKVPLVVNIPLPNQEHI